MPILDTEIVTEELKNYLGEQAPEVISPAMSLKEDLQMSEEQIAGLLDHFGKKMRFPYDGKAGDQRIWFDAGLSHERTKEQSEADNQHGIDFGKPKTVQRLYQVVYQGFMNGPNFNEIGSG